MARYKESFTIFPRKLSSGKIVYYYRTYTPDGFRTTAHSTGLTNKTLARNYCNELLRQGLLYSGKGITFAVYAKDFFGPKSTWYKDKLQTGKGKEQAVAAKTLKAYIHNNDKYLIPYFGKFKLCDINASHVRLFRDEMMNKGLSAASINLSCACLKIIFTYARSDNLMQSNPFSSLKQIYTDAKSKSAYDIDILTTTFMNWRDDRWKKYFALVGAVTGMRISEICAIRDDTLYPDYIDVKDQFLDNELVPVKVGEKRKVRICNELYTILKSCTRLHRNGMAFNYNQDLYRQAFYDNLPFNKEERIKRKLTFHSLRHFVNTYLLSHEIAEIKVKCILGHSSGKGSMTERYANFNPSDFDDFAECQKLLINQFVSHA